MVGRQIGSLILKLIYYIPHILIPICIISLSYIYFTLGFRLAIGASIILVPLLIASIILVILSKSIKNNLKISEINLFNTNIGKNRLLVVFLIVALFEFSWVIYARDRGIIFFVLLILMYFVILLQIFEKDMPHPAIILLELIFTTSILVITRQIFYAYYVQTPDIIFHSKLVEILSSDLNVPIEIGDDYTNYSIHHLLSALFSNITGLLPHLSIILTGASLLIITCIFVYYISKIMTNSVKISMLSAFFYLTIPMSLNNIAYPLPKYLSVFLFTIFLYMFLKINGGKIYVYWFIFGIITIFLTLTHYIHPLVAVFFIILICISYYLYNHHFSKGQIGIIILSLAIPVIYLVQTMLANFIHVGYRNIFAVFDSSSNYNLAETSYSSGTLPNIDLTYFVTYLSSSIIVLFVLFGLYYILISNDIKYNNLNNFIKVITPLSLIFFPLFVEGIADISSYAMNVLMVDRFRSIIVPLYAIIMGVGSIVFCGCINTLINNKKITKIIVVVICSLLVIFSPLLSMSTDSAILSGTAISSHKYFNENDINTVNLVHIYLPSDSMIYTDYPTNVLITTLMIDKDKVVKTGSVSYDISDIFESEVSDVGKYQYFLFRNDIYQNIGLKVVRSSAYVRTSMIYPTNEMTETLQRNLMDYELILDSGETFLYHSY